MATRRSAVKTPRPTRRGLPAAVYEVGADGDPLGDFALLIPKNLRKTGNGRCHERLVGAREPCTRCPVLALQRNGQRRGTAVLAMGSDTYRVAVAEARGRGRYQVYMVSLPEDAVAALQRARIDQRLEHARLSNREHGVLELLLLGRGPAEIARALEITERTARFHISNILEKLEADSRSDLLRLLL